ncbi:hypothetical protein SEA_HOLLIDAY_98 [Gordonia phage Holliday]|nr:hypothetical protein SEA_HOLLIDAY_98 [Gordonia phage Holliday]
MAAVRNTSEWMFAMLILAIAVPAEQYALWKQRRHTAALAYQTAITECRCHCCEGTGLLG